MYKQIKVKTRNTWPDLLINAALYFWRRRQRR